MQTTWMLAADRSRLRIFEEQDACRDLREIANFPHPAPFAPLPPVQCSPGIDRTGTQRISRDASDYIERGCSEHRYDRLYVIATPALLRVLRHNLSGRAREQVETEIVKDISWFSGKDIEDVVHAQRH